jgi:hypothetical protein
MHIHGLLLHQRILRQWIEFVCLKSLLYYNVIIGYREGSLDAIEYDETKYIMKLKRASRQSAIRPTLSRVT